MAGAHTSSPETGTQSEVVAQQSALFVQREPSGAHVLVHAMLEACALQMPPQHSFETAHDAPSEKHVCACSQRIAPRLAESAAHVSDAVEQHCALALQISPSAPHPLCAQRFTLVASATHDPEQQSASASHRSQSGAQPPIDAHRCAPSLCITHSREQHSLAFAHASPATRMHGFASPAVHAATGAQ